MHPEEAQREIADLIDANLDGSGTRYARTYRRTIRRVAEEGDETKLTELTHRLGAAVRAGSRPTPAEARAAADRVLDRPLTDGGE